MSTASPTFHSNSKFTRGEKCIFAHLIITFVAIIAIVLFYFTHVVVVKHLGDDVYRISRRSHTDEEHDQEQVVASAFSCVGAAYVQGRAACGAAGVRARWALVPARCVSVRARPELAPLLPHWTLRYQTVGVRRGVVHPQYEDDELVCNVGLFELEAAVGAPLCVIPTVKIDDEMLKSGLKDSFVVGWQVQGGRSVSAVRSISPSQCSQFTAPVVEAAQLCVARTDPFSLHAAGPLMGAVLFVNSKMAAITSWGDTTDKSFPFIVTDIAPFKHWLETTMSLG